jgi:nucleoid-associated protein YgaU
MKIKIWIAIVCISTMVGMGYYYATEPPKKGSVVYTVKSNDTLWDIANQYKKDGEDVRKVYYQIMKDNDISDGMIIPGQKLQICHER